MLHFIRAIMAAAAVLICMAEMVIAGDVCAPGQTPPNCCTTNYMYKGKTLSFKLASDCPFGKNNIIKGLKESCPDCAAPSITKAPDGSKTFQLRGVTSEQFKAITEFGNK
jgi:hypothetical protein